jgi:6-phosphogluconolactonase
MTPVMMKPTLVVAADAQALARAAADFVCRIAREARGPFCLALSGGSTPRPLYRLLASPEHRSNLPWDETRVFFADERAVPPERPDSNFGMVRELLLSRVPIPEAHIHRMRGEAEDLSAAAQDYEWELAAGCSFPRGSREPGLDLILLGLGDDGHTASLFPKTSALREEDRWVVANYVPKLGARRLTLTYPVIAAAERVAFIVSGAGKARIVRRVLEGDGELPATRAAAHPRVTFLLDEAAAAEMRPAGR